MSRSKPGAVKVWDPVVRVLHWTLAASVLLAALSGFALLGLVKWHEVFGYTAAATITARAVWGFVGRGHAHFASFVRRASTTADYGRQLLQGRAPRHIGHNPLGGWMIVMLLSVVAALAFTGWLFTTDMFWGYGWLANLHLTLAWLLILCIAIHLAGVALMSWKHRENLVAAMLTGDKRAPTDDDIA